MIDVDAIEEKLFDQLYAALADYTVERAVVDNTDPNIAAQNDGWINVWVGDEIYDAHRTGNRPWRGSIQLNVRVQVASMEDRGAAVSARMQAAKKAVLEAIEADRTIGGTVLMIVGPYTISPDAIDIAPYWRRLTITVNAEVRS